MKVALAQLNTTVGDFAGNEAAILAAYRRGADAGAAIVVCPELCITGYPPRDLLLKPPFVARNTETLDRLAAATGRTALLAGFVGENNARPGRGMTNSVALLQHGRIAAARAKSLLPTYDVFDEDRYFEAATDNAPVDFNGGSIALTICEDIWNDEDFWPERRYRHNPPVKLADAGAQIIFNSLRVAMAPGEEQDPPRDAAEPGAQDRPGSRVLQPGRRERRIGFRRGEPGVQCDRPPDRAGKSLY